MPYKDSQKQKEWEQTNREKRLKQKKEIYQKNKIKIKKYHKEWYQRNKERIDLKHKEYRQTPEGKQKQREYYQNNPEVDLRAQMKHLKRLAIPFKLSYTKYRLALLSWSATVKKRDNKVCQVCGSTHKLNSHHIFYKSKYPKLSLNTNNGVTLCHLHHREVHRLN